MDGFGQHVFVTDLQLPEELPKLDRALRAIRDQTDIINTFEAWYFDFEGFYNDNVKDLESMGIFLSQSVNFMANTNTFRWHLSHGYPQRCL